jgi:cell division transport system permease protein
MSVASVVVTAVTLLALGCALLVATTLDQIAGYLERQVQVTVFVRDGLSGDEVAALRGRLARIPGVVSLEYVSKDEALARLAKTLGGGANIHDLLDHNPLPASFVINADRPGRLEAIAAAARRLPQIEDVSYGVRSVARLLAATRIVRLLGSAAGGILALIALVIIGSTIRLAVVARRAEIEIMRLVGATAWFIRWPFLVEGAITGAAGAVAAVILVAAGYVFAVSRAQGAFPFLPLAGPEQVVLAVSWKLLAWGITIGIVGSLLAVRRYLRV